MRKLIIILLLLFPFYLSAEETLTGDYEEDIVNLKDELRQLRKDQDADTLGDEDPAYYSNISNSTITGETSGDIQYYDGSNWNRLAKGTAGQVLQTGTPPSWVTKGFGAWVNKSASYAAQQASTDGFVICVAPAENTAFLYTDSGANPTTIRGQCAVSQSMMTPVKSGEYWKVTVDGGSPTVYWIPLN